MRHSKQREQYEQSPRGRSFQEKLRGTSSRRFVGSKAENEYLVEPSL